MTSDQPRSSLAQATRWVVGPSSRLTEPGRRRSSWLLSVCVLIMTSGFIAIDIAFAMTRPGYTPPWIGYMFLLGTFLVNRLGYYLTAAWMVMAMFPIVAFAIVLTSHQADPIAALNYLVLSPLLASILLPVRGVIALAAINAIGMTLLAVFTPGSITSPANLVGPLSVNVVAAALAVLAVWHRNAVERDRLAEQRALESRLQQSQRMESIGRLAGGIAHDFNNLLTVIMGNTSLLQSRRDDEELTEIAEASAAASTLTKRLLTFSRRAVVKPEVINLNDSVRSAIKLVHRIIGEDIAVEFHPDPDLWRTRVDGGQIQQIIMNLASNARDAMPDGGQLSFRTHNEPANTDNPSTASPPGSRGWVILSVSDTGVGMDEEARSQAFEPFFSTKEIGEGTGLGLAIVFGIVAQSEGRIEVVSEPGQGSTFNLYFPRSMERMPERNGVPATTREGSETLLVVEDDDRVRSLVNRVLSAAGYRVLLAAVPSEARTLWESRKDEIDLILTDVIMPQCSGPDLARELRAERPSVKIAYMSGYAPQVAVGATDSDAIFLRKPFEGAQLQTRVRAILDAPVGGRPDLEGDPSTTPGGTSPV